MMEVKAKTIFQHSRSCGNCKHCYPKDSSYPADNLSCRIRGIDFDQNKLDLDQIVCDRHAKSSWIYRDVDLNQLIAV